MNTLSPLMANRTLAFIVLLAVAMWSFGLGIWTPTSSAAALTTASDTLSDSDLNVLADHTIVFTSPTGIVNGETVTITFSADWNLSTSTVDFTDIDVASTSDITIATDCSGSDQIGVSIAGQVLTLTYCSGDGEFLAAGATTTIEMGLNASFGVAGDAQVTNPSNAGSYSIDLAGTQVDTGQVRVAIIDDVVVTASVDTTLVFAINGIGAGSTVNGSPTSTEASTATALPFGTITPGLAKTIAQNLTVTTNAPNGFTVTANMNQNLTSSTGADIDRFIDDAGTASPVAWVQPTGTFGAENTYGHIAITSEDSSLVGGDDFGSDLWAGDFVNNPREVFYNTGPADGVTTDVGSTTVGYQIDVSVFQEAGTDYTANITYVATPVF